MAKYSTGGGGRHDGDSCELCGRETGNLRRARVAGASLLVCSDCAPHDDNASKRERRRDDRQGGEDRGEPENRRKRAARNAARLADASKGDSKRWEEEGTNYEEDRLPYLVGGYGGVVEAARQDAGLTVEELAADLGVDEDDVLAVEQGRATRARVGGSVVRAIEERLGVDIVDE
jgi:ribosome-binding protein aMBF1 (putative translation factor)